MAGLEIQSAGVRTFETGANRSAEGSKPDFEGFLSPQVLERYGEYMTSHRILPDGSIRDSDNWQKGIPLTAYIKSAFRHFVDWWSLHRDPTVKTRDNYGLEESLCAVIFNASGYLHEILKARKYRKGQ